jgi:hypothetical protein
MKTLRSSIAILLAIVIAAPAFAGVGSHEAVYHGGTFAIKSGATGALDLHDASAAVFRSKGADIRIPYDAVTSIEYGQKAGRRLGAAIATTILVSPVGLALLLSHKRKHIVTLMWTADGKNEAAVFELGKGEIRGALTTLEARSGKKIDYESPDARKNIGL